MLPLSHLGIGSTIAKPFSKKLPFFWLLLGTMLPDLINKPIYFIIGIWAYLDHGGWVPGKRGIAHTLLFLLLIVSLGWIKKSRILAALGVGISTHLLLDILSKSVGPAGDSIDKWTVLFWPFLGFEFPTLAYGLHGKPALTIEIIGGMLLMIQLALHYKIRKSRNT